VLGPLDGALETVLAGVAFQVENQLLGGLSLLAENGLGLTLLLSVVTQLALGEDRLLRLLVLSHLELLMLVSVGTVSPASFWDVAIFVRCSTGKARLGYFRFGKVTLTIRLAIFADDRLRYLMIQWKTERQKDRETERKRERETKKTKRQRDTETESKKDSTSC
jgi:hypothetical protein